MKLMRVRFTKTKQTKGMPYQSINNKTKYQIKIKKKQNKLQ